MTRIRDWTTRDTSHLLVRTQAVGWQYEVTLDRRCQNLPLNLALGVRSFDNRICNDRGDAIAVRAGVCVITGIRRLTAPEANPAAPSAPVP